MSVFAHVLPYIGSPALVLALGSFVWRFSRAWLLGRAGRAALKHGSEDPHGEAGLKIVDALTHHESEPWYRALLPGSKSDDSSP